MSNLVLFKSKSNVNARIQLDQFIDFAKNKIHMFGKELDFDADSWDITEYLNARNKGTNRVNVLFNKHQSKDLMHAEYRLFAKAYFRYMYAFKIMKNVNYLLLPLRLIEKALWDVKKSTCVIDVDSHVLDMACQYATDSVSVETAYLAGVQLEKIHQFLIEHSLCEHKFKWVNHLKSPGRVLSRIGAEFDAKRESKMPSQAVLDALPKAFHLASSDSDVIATSVGAILCSAPDRINEVLLLPVNCQVEQGQKDETVAYGLRWWTSKGAEPMIKWIIPSMSDVVRTAISKITNITAEARKVSSWYELNPDKIYLPSELEHLRSSVNLDMNQLEQVLWSDEHKKGRALKWCTWYKLDVEIIKQKAFVKFSDVERIVLGMIPNGFPFVNKEIGLHYKDALFVVLENQLHDTLSTYRCMISPVSYHQINIRFGNCESKKSVFTKLGLFGEHGEELSVSTHQFRHYLNTLAQIGGLSQLDIAKWSGRKDIHQNAVYDHETSSQLVNRIRTSISDAVFGPERKTHKIIPIRRDEFERLVVPTAHTTEFGYCIHDYTMSPCTEHMDCINCQELVCIKGECSKKENLERLLKEHKVLMLQAEQAVNKGMAGADRWLDRHRGNVERMEQLVSILNNDAIPDGSVIQMTPPQSADVLEEQDLSAMRNILNMLED